MRKNSSNDPNELALNIRNGSFNAGAPRISISNPNGDIYDEEKEIKDLRASMDQ